MYQYILVDVLIHLVDVVHVLDVVHLVDAVHVLDVVHPVHLVDVLVHLILSTSTSSTS